jgi:hypothetical protein
MWGDCAAGNKLGNLARNTPVALFVIPLQQLESISTRFEGMSVGDANPDSASASASVATVRSADVGVGTGKGAGDSAAASAPVATVRSAGAGVVAKKPCTSPESCRDAAMEELG